MSDFNLENLGKDLYIGHDDIHGSTTNDLSTVKFRENLAQSLLNHLRTRKGELVAHPDYGSELYKVVGERMTEDSKSLAELYTIEALRQDPRVWKIKNIIINTDRNQKLLSIEVSVLPIDSTETLNIVYPFFY